MRLVDDENEGKPVAHATLSLSGNDATSYQEVTTDREGQVLWKFPHRLKKMTARIIDAVSDISSPRFHLKDECANYFDVFPVEFEVKERMHAAKIATVSCQDFEHYAHVPVLINVAYEDDEDDEHRYPPNIHDRKRAVWIRDHGANENRPREFVLQSDESGIVNLRLSGSAANVTMTVLERPPSVPDTISLGLMAVEELPDRFSFVFRAFPKRLKIEVKDGHKQHHLSGVPVHVSYYDSTEDRHLSRIGYTNDHGQAEVNIDGCVEFASFTVSSPLKTSKTFCTDGMDYIEEKRLHWNIMDHQKFSLNLTPAPQASERRLRINTSGYPASIDRMTYTTDANTDTIQHIERGQDPFFPHMWTALIKATDRRLNLLTTADHHMGLTLIDLCCLRDDHLEDVSIIQDTVTVSIKALQKYLI